MAPMEAGAAEPVGFEVARTASEHGGATLVLSGDFTLDGADRLRSEVLRAGEEGPIGGVDLSAVSRMDGGAAATLTDALCTVGQMPELRGASPSVNAILGLYSASGGCAARVPAPPRVPFLVQVGRATMEIVATVQAMLRFIASATGALLAALRRPSTVGWRSVATQVERHGADGLPIVAVIGALMGLITAFQAAIQLSKFGADTFVANLVSLSLTRELAPLMTAIVVAGRSGAAIAAEMGTMKVGEEIDALETLGICPHRYLVFPRIIALAVVLPLLTLVADIVGILAGAAITTTILEVGFRQFVVSTREALTAADVVSGLVKAVAFGFLIAGIAAERGLSARGGAEGVGRVTTAAVVGTLFFLVLTDALFAVLFELWGVL